MQKKIKALVSDIDGVWTNGELWLGENGEWRRTFYIHDGLGLLHLMKAGIKVAVLSNSNTEDIQKRVKHLGIEEVHLGVSNKRERFLEILKKWNLDASEVAYVGDDVIDLEVLEMAGLSFTVPNAHKKVLENKKFICTEKEGGRGAIREICDRLLDQ